MFFDLRYQLALFERALHHALPCTLLGCHVSNTDATLAWACISSLLLMPAGNCKYTVHEDDVQWDAAKDVWDGLPPREKDR